MSDSMEIPLTRGKVALVSPEDYERVVSEGKWHAYPGSGTWYARRNGAYVHGKRGIPVTMHRFILNAPNGMEVDHRDRDGLNNTRENIRLATRSENMRNQKAKKTSQTGLKGVRRNSFGFRASVTHLGTIHFTRTFRTKEEAAHARDLLASQLHGDFLRRNEDCYDPSVKPQVMRQRRANPGIPVGVIVNKSKYQAVINFRGKRMHLGTFEHAQDAHETYVKKYEELHRKPFGGMALA